MKWGRCRQIFQKVVNGVIDLCCWTGIAFAALMLLQVVAVTSFKIPSDSMEPALVAGDAILVEKWTLGGRIFNLMKAVDREPVKMYRLPGWGNLKRNDVLVFNYPYAERWDSLTFDVMTYYVKRCIALPGDTLEIRDAHYRVRGCEEALGCVEAQDELEELLKTGRAHDRGVVVRSYPEREGVAWTIGEFGPFYVPRRGDCIAMTPLHEKLYNHIIEWEQQKPLTLRGDDVLLGDSIIREYTFKENYYFVSGDKMANSRDSRYWGLLPESFVVGRVWRIWMSKDLWNQKIRWNRLWKKVE